MPPIIRLATSEDASAWVTLLQSSYGKDLPTPPAYDVAWVVTHLGAASGNETWVVEAAGVLQAAVTFLKSEGQRANPIGNLGRNLFLPESFKNGNAHLLMDHLVKLGRERKQMLVIRVASSSQEEMGALEKAGFLCVGFQPLKHILRSRVGTFFYLHPAELPMIARAPLQESLAQVSSLASLVLGRLSIPVPAVMRDGTTGYPLQSGLKIHTASWEDFDLWKQQAQSGGPTELSTGAHRGTGFLRIDSTSQNIRTLLGQRDSQIVAGLAFLFDEPDRCIRMIDCFTLDDGSLGDLLQHAVKISQDTLSAAYVEMDVLMTAPRLIKTADQLGFVPVAYFPALSASAGPQYADVVKLVKLNMVYSRESGPLTPQGAEIAHIIDVNFQDQKVGVAIVNLLRGLPIFDGLGDGELRKISRLFTQKLYRPGEFIFRQGDSSNEAYIVMRGTVDIGLEGNPIPIASIDSGQIFGEVAFLDGANRTANALARVPSILLVVQRSAFYDLVQKEPHLGMVVIRNMAIDLSNKLRRSNTSLFRESDFRKS